MSQRVIFVEKFIYQVDKCSRSHAHASSSTTFVNDNIKVMGDLFNYKSFWFSKILFWVGWLMMVELEGVMVVRYN